MPGWPQPRLTSSRSWAPTWCRRGSTPTLTSPRSPAPCCRPRCPMCSGPAMCSAKPAPSPRSSRAPCCRHCAEAGLGLRVHGNQLGQGPGVKLAAEMGAASVDHLNYLSDDDVQPPASTWESSGRDHGLRRPRHGGDLPAGLRPFDPPAAGRRAQTARRRGGDRVGLELQSGNQLHLLDELQRLHRSAADAPEPGRGDPRAATLGGAAALRAQDTVGSVEVERASLTLHVLDAPAAIHLAYRPGMPLTHAVWRRGQRRL